MSFFTFLRKTVLGPYKNLKGINYDKPLDLENELSVWQHIYVLVEDAINKYENSLSQDFKELEQNEISQHLSQNRLNQILILYSDKLILTYW